MTNNNFNCAESLCLVEIYCSEQIQQQFKSNKKSHGRVWENIVVQMSENNYHRSEQQCKDRIKNLKAIFFKKKRLPSGSGQENWPYYWHFTKLFGGTPLSDPLLIVDSLDDRVLETLNPLLDEDVEDMGGIQQGERPESSPKINGDSPAEEDKSASISRLRKRKAAQKQDTQVLLKYLKEMDSKDDKKDEVALNEMNKIGNSIEKLVDIEERKLLLKERMMLSNLNSQLKD